MYWLCLQSRSISIHLCFFCSLLVMTTIFVSHDTYVRWTLFLWMFCLVCKVKHIKWTLDMLHLEAKILTSTWLTTAHHSRFLLLATCFSHTLFFNQCQRALQTNNNDEGLSSNPRPNSGIRLSLCSIISILCHNKNSSIWRWEHGPSRSNDEGYR